MSQHFESVLYHNNNALISSEADTLLLSLQEQSKHFVVLVLQKLRMEAIFNNFNSKNVQFGSSGYFF